MSGLTPHIKKELAMLSLLLLILCWLGSASGRQFHAPDKQMNVIEDPKTASTIDFSQGEIGPDGLVCVERRKTLEKTEKDQLKECFVQNVTQCYYTYITEYSDADQEKCEDFYWKQCKIVFKQRTYNATSRQCKRPLQKICDDQSSPQPVAPFSDSNGENLICETFFETECNTTDVIPEQGDEPLAVTFCDKLPRKICAPDNCRVVEGIEKCTEETTEQIVDYPVELCDLQPQKHCRTVKVAVPRLVPEKKCREVEKSICNAQLVNPHDEPRTVIIKYCTRKEIAEASQTTHSGYLPPPPPPRYSKASIPPPPPPPFPVYGAPSNFDPPPPPAPYQNSYGAPNTLRNKRDPSEWETVGNQQPLSNRRTDRLPEMEEDTVSISEMAASSPEKVHPASNMKKAGSQKKRPRSGRQLNINMDFQPWEPMEKL